MQAGVCHRGVVLAEGRTKSPRPAPQGQVGCVCREEGDGKSSREKDRELEMDSPEWEGPSSVPGSLGAPPVL